ncbi:MAG TPA: DUF5615 family PIN-like protein [Caulobacterales bacterium]|nr:DUF5615 family PIN-like protein [Caulobacterales bacterium]
MIDANLPPLLAKWIADGGKDSATHLLAWDEPARIDPDIWQAATKTGHVIVTKDVDFAYLALGDPEGPQVVWIRCGNLTLVPFKYWFAARWPEARVLLADGARLVELR